MVLLLHIVIALTSLLVATAALVRPSKRLFTASVSFVGLTVLSGAILLTQGVSVWHLCLSGLAYVALASAANVLAYRRLQAAAVSTRQ